MGFLRGNRQPIQKSANVFSFGTNNEGLISTSSTTAWSRNYINFIRGANRQWTLSCWLQTTTTAAGNGIIFSPSGFVAGDSGLQIYRSGANLLVQIYTSSPTLWTNTYNSFFTANTPIHFCMQWDYSQPNASGAKVRIYRNGIFTSVSSSSGSGTDMGAGSSASSSPCVSYNANGWLGYMGAFGIYRGLIEPQRLMNLGCSYDLSLRTQALVVPDMNVYNWNGSGHDIYDFYYKDGIQGTTANCEEGDITNNIYFR